MPGDSEQQGEPARVVLVARDKRRFVNNKCEILTLPDSIILATEEQRQRVKLFDQIRLKWAIANTKPLAIIGRVGQVLECGNFFSVIFSTPIPNDNAALMRQQYL